MKIKRVEMDFENFQLNISFNNATDTAAAYRRIIEDVATDEKKELDTKLRGLINNNADGGGVIRAIKAYRAITGLSLKESKEYIDTLRDKL
jgi:ribosomal protein L7/L12